MKLKSLFTSLLITLSMSNVAIASSTDDAIASAVKANAAAAEVGYEWRDTGKMIKSAKKLSASGKQKEAMALANKAKNQAVAALSQYKTETARYSKNH